MSSHRRSRWEMRMRARVRRECGVLNSHVPVRVILGSSCPPTVTGRPGGTYTHGGRKITDLNTARKHSWSQVVHHDDRRKVYVGSEWIAQQMEVGR